jgi:DNA-binding MarR family transcriptional regulator
VLIVNGLQDSTRNGSVASAFAADQLAQDAPVDLAGMMQTLLFAALLGGAEQWAEADLTMPQLKVLLLLAQFGSVPVSWLAGRMGVSPPNITGILDRLEAHERTRRSVDARDRRVVRVDLEPSGAMLLWSLCQDGAQKLRQAVGALDPADAVALSTGISALVRSLASTA